MANSRKLLRVTEPADIPEYLIVFLQQYLLPSSHLSLGLSGGLDSSVLLDLLVQARAVLGFRLSAIHINHQISPHADGWASFCAQLCISCNVPFTSITVDVPRNSGLGLEASARNIRYSELLKHTADALLLAQHQDDQAETLLLQLLRGSGMDGLAAMPEVREQRSKPVLRPFLGLSRRLLELYAHSRNLRWIEDESNQDCDYDRNFLRHKVFPKIESRFPAYRVTLGRVIENFSTASHLLAELAEEDASKAIDKQRLDISWMRTQTCERSINLLRWWIERETGMNLSRARLFNILDQLLNARANAQVECQLGDMVLRRYRHWAWIDRQESVKAYNFIWQGQEWLKLPDGRVLNFNKVVGQGISVDRIKKNLVITNRCGVPLGWKMVLQSDALRPVRTLKNLWQEAGISPWERDKAVLIWHGDELVWVSGLGTDFRWQVAIGYLGLSVNL